MSSGESEPVPFLLTAEQDPRKVAVLTPEHGGWRSTTYEELETQVEQLAGRLGNVVNSGDRVLLEEPPSADWIAGYLAIERTDAVAVPISSTASAPERDWWVEAVDPAATMRGSGVLQPLAHARATATNDDLALLMATSGTWGSPRLVALTRENVDYMVRTLTPLQQAHADDRWLSVLPLTHMLEIACVVLPALRSGATIVFADSLIPDDLLHMMDEQQITRMMTVPALLRALLQRVSDDRSRLPSSLHTLYCGGAPLDAGVGEAFGRLGVDVYAGYGLTETSPTVAVNRPDEGGNRFGSVGRVLPGTEIVVDADSGELFVRGPGVCAGYWTGSGRPLERIDQDGWFHTGDIGSVDEDGFVWITGRLKNLIVLPSGVNVQPEEVEHVLHGDGSWREVAVAGIDEVVAVVCADASREEIETRVEQRTQTLVPHKRPTRVVLLDRPLPRTSKKELHRQALQQIASVSNDA